MEIAILESILRNRMGQKIEVTTDRNVLIGFLRFLDVHGNLILEDERKHTVFIQRSWIVSITLLESDTHG